MCPPAPRTTAKAAEHLVEQAVHLTVRIVESTATPERSQTHLFYLLLFIITLPPLRAMAELAPNWLPCRSSRFWRRSSPTIPLRPAPHRKLPYPPSWGTRTHHLSCTPGARGGSVFHHLAG